MVVPRGEVAAGIPVTSTGTFPLTLACPAGARTCVLSGDVTTTSSAMAHSLLQMAATPHVLARFWDVHVRGGARRTVTLRMGRANLAALQVARVQVLGAVASVRNVARTTSPAAGAARLRLRVPRARGHRAVTG